MTVSSTDILARTLWGESRGEGENGMTAVANVVVNRVRSGITWWGHSITSVCLAPYQFSTWNSDDPNLPKIRAVTSADKQFMTALRIASCAVAGKLPDSTKNATSYKVTSLPWPSSWGPEREPLCVIGHQSFYDLTAPLKSEGPTHGN